MVKNMFDDGLVQEIASALDIPEKMAAKAVLMVLDNITARIKRIAEVEKVDDAYALLPKEVRNVYGRHILNQGRYQAAVALAKTTNKHAIAIKEIYGEPSW